MDKHSTVSIMAAILYAYKISDRDEAIRVAIEIYDRALALVPKKEL